MLLKKILTTYGNSVSTKPGVKRLDHIHARIAAEYGDDSYLVDFRNDVLDALSSCRPFFVDHQAASLIDTLSPDLEQHDEDYMNDIELPADVIWVKYDDSAMGYARQKRGGNITDEEIEAMGHRGVLLDARNPKELSIKLFRGTLRDELIDPLAQHIFLRGADGKLDMVDGITRITPHVNQFFSSFPEITQEMADEMLSDEVESAASAYIFAYGLLAMIKSQPDDIILGTREVFTRKEQKTARKFGKTHITEGPQSHITINLTEPAKRYLAQLEEEAEDRAAIARGQAPRVRHDVREHVRRYKSGKVVIVKAHKRGSEPDTRPTLVTAGDDSPEP